MKKTQVSEVKMEGLRALSIVFTPPSVPPFRGGRKRLSTYGAQKIRFAHGSYMLSIEQ